ncbi:HAD family hydrolase [Nakamurella lactea]|uniref:HAD family hydrolase n=1 Tax=Nakamurella lactea TaxID=459515 RepID=UPI000407DB5F|nr:HAD family hydrolase [Nakamurella lactea]
MTVELTTWRDGATKSAIVDFVARVTDKSGSDFVPAEERIAVFDNDGTLWPEKPLVIQLDFTVRRFGELAEQDPELRTVQPYQAAYEKNLGWLSESVIKHYRGDDSDFALVLKAVPKAFESVTVEAYDAKVREFFVDAANPQLKRPYLACGYGPMVELLRYLEDNGFTTYIASGGDRDFMRPIAGTMYGIPPERVVGSAVGLGYDDDDGRSNLLYKGEMDFFDDGPEKPIRIWSRIGRRPILAVGNSNGDIPMLSFAGGPDLPALRLLLKHDDAEREFDYIKGAEKALELADAQDWTVVSIANDWASVFADVD